MFRLLLTCAVVLVASGMARGDGLLYQLPKDGDWVQFELKITESNQSIRKQIVILRSVGRTEEGERCRWIELQVPDEESTRLLKLLIPEKYLKKGESPLDHVVRGWSKRGDNDPESFLNTRDFWLQVFLAGPLQDVKKLDNTVVDSPLGELKCTGLSGKAQITEDDGYEEELAYQVRRHDKAPFGVVSCRIDCRVKRGGKVQADVLYELKLTDVGAHAESELPGYQ